ncbi:MBL fold metallo-hydrolase [Desulfitobacterium metallireducens]|uniref:Beta-lactamase n=1 Tax=Desulfitobacterium metallireducens DSM 15288 TaxID=871968 RepID=W0EFY5_9FIRM|nr:MBL fold metallo-hydrolase [Desulfitobacterium metallireducens]AHF08119.1 beta-lactamase [Desulfitobacterium metallireducens DSM 15288]
MPEMREIAPNIYQLKVPLKLSEPFINVYIFRGETPTLMDTGTNTPGVFEMIQTALQRLGIKRLEQVIATHWHVDHAGAAHQFAKKGARILIGAKDYGEWKTFATGESFGIFREWARDEWEIPDGLVIEGMVKTYEKLRHMTSWPDQVEQIAPFQTLHAGNYALKAIPTPGHTMGHLAFFEEQQKMLFSGDILLPDQVAYPGIWLEEGKVTSGLPSQLKSLDTLEKLNALQYFPAHGEPQVNTNERCQESRAQILHQVQKYDPHISVYEGALRLRQGKANPVALFTQLHQVYGWKQVNEQLSKSVNILEENG